MRIRSKRTNYRLTKALRVAALRNRHAAPRRAAAARQLMPYYEMVCYLHHTDAGHLCLGLPCLLQFIRRRFVTPDRRRSASRALAARRRARGKPVVNDAVNDSIKRCLRKVDII